MVIMTLQNQYYHTQVFNYVSWRCINFAKIPKFIRRIKHIAIKYHHFRRFISDGTIIMNFIETTKQIVDFFFFLRYTPRLILLQFLGVCENIRTVTRWYRKCTVRYPKATLDEFETWKPAFIMFGNCLIKIVLKTHYYLSKMFAKRTHKLSHKGDWFASKILIDSLHFFLHYKVHKNILVILYFRGALIKALLYPSSVTHDISMTNLLSILGMQYYIFHICLFRFYR